MGPVHWFSVALAFLTVYSVQCTLFPEECGGHPCLNGGECYFSFDEKLGDQFYCRCLEPYYGTSCDKVGNLTEYQLNITTADTMPTENEYNLTTEYYLTTNQGDDNTSAANTTDTFFTLMSTASVTPKDPCSGEPCQNGGICQVEGSTFKCFCPTPFTGRTCSIGPCSDSPCKNGGICAVKGNSHTCYCPHPFTGRNCEIDPCSSNPCKNEGICKIEGSTFRCSCKPPYYGPRCEKDTCYNNPCENGGICKANGYRFKCYCSSPFSGRLCEKGPCSGNPCKHNGICEVKGNSHVCYCQSPYSGKLCEITPCSYKPCANNGTCAVYGDSFICFCKRPYYGDLCQQDPCTVNPCQNNGTCEVNRKSFTCACKEPFTGRLCNEVLTSSTNPATKSEAITTTPKPDKCECPNGYCVTSTKGVQCVCNPGFGKNPNGDCEECHCGERFNCTFEKRWFITYKTCICPKGYEEINEKCVDACYFSPCENGGTCRLTNDSYACDCPEAFTGRRCQIEKCSSANCKNGKCITNEKGKTKCVCNPGFAKHPDGHCQACDCGKEFNCTFEKKWFVTNKICNCPKSYEEVKGKCRDPCYFKPCWNGGTCKLTDDSYTCECPEEFTGARCQRRKCNCENGKCIKSGKDYKCVCNSDYGIYTPGVCKACKCGKNFTCTFDRGVFWDNIYCVCPEGFSMVNKECISK